MDYSKLTTDERINALNFHNLSRGTILPTNWNELLQIVKIEPGEAVATEIVDLYIATELYKSGIQVPNELNMDNITADYYRKLAPVIYLPQDYTPENLTRAKRIIRIIRDFIKETPGTEKIQILPVIFTIPGKIGDFNWMMQQPQYNDVLFLFNDNESQFLQFINNPGSKEACARGGGNAIIRPYQCLKPPRAAGIPTGDVYGGYKNLNKAKYYIDMAFDHIKNLLQTGNYKRIAYSAANDGRTLGTQIFSPSEDIKDYIVTNIEALAK